MGFVTIKDISLRAGVSKATVSRVLNNPEVVHPDTREHIERIMADLHYTPSATARNLSKSSSSTIGAVVADIANPFLSQLLKGVLSVCDREGYTLLCADNSDLPEHDFQALDTMREQRVAGLIYAPAVDYAFYSETDRLRRKLKDLRAPVVLVDRRICWDDLDADGVFFDDYAAIKKAIKALASSGHRRIAVINSNEKNYLAQRRHMGYVDGLQAAGLPVCDELIFAKGKYALDVAYQQAQELLSMETLPDAVITCNNHLTLGFLKALYESKRVRPDEITYIGLDDLDMMDILGIRYNYIKRDAFQMGQEAAKQLFQRLAHPDDSRREVLLEAPLVLQTL